MEYVITDDTEQNYFILKASGNFDVDEHGKILSQIVNHSNWRKGKNVLVDYREASFDRVSMDGVVGAANIVGTMDEEYGASHCALVVPDDAFTKATFYKFEASAQTNIETRIFRDKEYSEAVRWINSQSVK